MARERGHICSPVLRLPDDHVREGGEGGRDRPRLHTGAGRGLKFGGRPVGSWLWEASSGK